MGSFVPRLLALTVIWLLATAALTYAAAQRIAPKPATTATTAATTTAAQQVLVVPDVRRQAFVFAKGTLGDNGFGWRVEGAVHGFASNLVATQMPAAGTRVFDTGAPLIVLHLTHAGSNYGLPEDVSSPAPTKLTLADNPLPALEKTVLAHTTHHVVATAKKPVAKKAAAKKPAAPPDRWPQARPPAFTAAGARREPLDEMPLTVRAKMLFDWLAKNPKPTDANVKHWLYQHAWIVTGAEMGWWHGEDALRTLVAADRRVWALWGIGDRSQAVARQALAEVAARSK